jgi:signal recognition particle subunit SRP54
LLVVDAMTGQDATETATRFHASAGLTGVILTKLDGDARGGAALSVREAAGVPIKLVGTGEAVEDLDVFHPERMISRILDLGDVMTLIEKAEAAFDETEAARLEEKFRKASFTLEDFLEQLDKVRQMGPISNLIGMLPGASAALKGAEVDDAQVGKVEAIIRSMTPQERRNPAILNGSRRARIARGSGTQVTDVNALIRQFGEARKMMKTMSRLGANKRKKVRR